MRIRRVAAFLRVLATITPLAAGPARAGETGDLDGDGRVDVTDAVFVLEHLFRGGPPPAAGDPLPGLPVSGVVTCFAGDFSIECPAPGEPSYGQDGNHRAGRPRDFDVVRPDPADPSTWTTQDFATGLEWQYLPDPGRKTWKEALHAARGLRLGGHQDWRLPSISELLSIFSFELGRPALDPDAFSQEWEDLRNTSFWSSTTFPVEGGGSEALVVDFIRGTVHTAPKEPGYQPAYARMVRTMAPPRSGDLNGDGGIDLGDAVRLLFHLFAAGPAMPLRGPVRGIPATGQIDCYDSAARIPCESLEEESDHAGQDGHLRPGAPRRLDLVKPDPTSRATWYVLDRTTGLAWQYAESTVSMTLEEALAHCEGLVLGGFDDWRLPNVREIQSIADYGRHPTIDPATFGMDTLSLEGRDHWEFWTSSPGLTFYMDLGFVAGGGFAGTRWVRAVRTAGEP